MRIGEIDVNYIQYGEGEDIALLHGWGQNIEMMLPLARQFPNYRITILDLPGFGKSSEPTSVWNIFDYATFLHDFLEQVGVTSPILMGHSFGGRVAICYASRYAVSKLVLFGSPCVREDSKVSLKEKTLKTVAKMPIVGKLSNVAKTFIGSSDYRNASPRMRDILVQVVNQDLSDCAKEITCPTLLIWGSLDTAPPVEDARKLEALLKDGALFVLDVYTHYAYLEALPQVVSILGHFI